MILEEKLKTETKDAGSVQTSTSKKEEQKNKEPSKNGKLFSLKYFPYDFVKWTGALSAWLIFRPKVKFVSGKRRLWLDGPFLLSANHQAFSDPIMSLFVYPFRRSFFVAMEGVFDTPIKEKFFTSVGCIKVNRENVGIDTIRAAGQVFREKKGLCIFPEGKIGNGVEGAVFKPGCAMMSILNNVPVVPVYISKRKSLWQRIKIVVGEPVYPKDIVGESKSLVAIEDFNKYLYEREKELYEYYKSVYGGKE